MNIFPIQNLKYNKATLKGVDGDVSIEIAIEPFELSLDEFSEDVETSIRLESVNIPANLKKLEGKTFVFPVNPEDGYIDGSIYFFAAHNPIDVTKIIFGESISGKLSLTLETNWVLEFEMTGFKNLSTTVVTSIEL